jgi:hypothetical protein
MIRDALTRRDLLNRLDDGSARDGFSRDGFSSSSRPVERMSFDSAPPPARPPVVDDEPTGDVAAPRRSFLGRLDGRTRSILTGAAVAAVIVNASAVWAYWRITGSHTGRANAGAVVELNMRGRSDLNKPLTPGGTGALVVAVTNDNDFSIRITAVSPGAGNVVADTEHRENGCVEPAVAVADPMVAVEWEVERNHVGAFTVPDGLTMAASADPACVGAVFTIPVVVRGVAGVS